MTPPLGPIPVPKAAELPLWRAAGLVFVAALLVTWALAVTGRAWAGDLERQARCMALIAYAEAAGEGALGLEAVMNVVRNRMRDDRFPDDACAVVLAPGQFQPVGESAALRRVLEDPESYELREAFGGRMVDEAVLRALLDAATKSLRWKIGNSDPTGGALFFVNPALMDLDKCPWFAGLQRTAVIGQHVFMNHRDGRPRLAPALDCERIALARAAGEGYRMVAEGPRPGRSPLRVTTPGRMAALAPQVLPDLVRPTSPMAVRPDTPNARGLVAAKLELRQDGRAFTIPARDETPVGRSGTSSGAKLATRHGAELMSRVGVRRDAPGARRELEDRRLLSP